MSTVITIRFHWEVIATIIAVAIILTFALSAENRGLR